MKKALFLLYGVICYAVFLGTALYSIGFVGNLFVGRSLDSAPQIPVLSAGLINASLLLLCCILHRMLTGDALRKWIPQPLERSTQLAGYSVCLILLLWRWQPMGGMVWQVERTVLKTVLYITYLSGWSIVFTSTFLIHHFELFGLRQVWLHYKSRPYKALPCRIPLLHELVRHPLYFGCIIACWATPVMSMAHLLLALFITGYIFISTQPGVRGLLTGISGQYSRFMRWVPLLLPFLKQIAQRY